MKKLVALLTAVVLLFSLTSVAYGAVSPEGKKEFLITVNNNVDSEESSDTLPEGEKHTLSAEEKGGYDFVGWSIEGEYEITSGKLYDSQITLLPKSDLTATAVYTRKVEMNDDELKVEYTHNIPGLEDGNYEIIQKGEQVEITASDRIPGYAFVKWEIIGNYEIISGSLDNKNLVILPLGNIIVKQIFEEVVEDEADDDKKPDKDKKPSKGETNDSDKSPQTGMTLPIFGLIAALGTAVVSKKMSK